MFILVLKLKHLFLECTYTYIIVIYQDCFMARSILQSKHLHTILCSKLDNNLIHFPFQCSSHQIKKVDK